jgi:hypothetical protein
MCGILTPQVGSSSFLLIIAWKVITIIGLLLSYASKKVLGVFLQVKVWLGFKPKTFVYQAVKVWWSRLNGETLLTLLLHSLLGKYKFIKLILGRPHPCGFLQFLEYLKRGISGLWLLDQCKFPNRLVWVFASSLTFRWAKRMVNGTPTFLLFFLCRHQSWMNHSHLYF